MPKDYRNLGTGKAASRLVFSTNLPRSANLKTLSLVLVSINFPARAGKIIEPSEAPKLRLPAILPVSWTYSAAYVNDVGF